MNKTKIDWCDMSWNPVTGCFHNCKYCYARKIAKRFGLHIETSNLEVLEKKFTHESNCIMTGEKESIASVYPYDFHPTFHKYRLDEPKKYNKSKTIFVGSMTDLFGDWVPDEWITQVFNSCEESAQHRYLFLTKNPKRYLNLAAEKKLPYKENIWLGTSLTKPSDEYVWFENTPYKTFVSIEPILEPFGDLERGIMPNWIIVGAETGNRKGKVIPKKEWIMKLKEQCNYSGVPIFMKQSLKELMGNDFVQEFPWEVTQ